MLIKYRYHLLVFILAFVFLSCGRNSLAAENDFEKLRMESAKIKTLQADFIQKKNMKILSKPLISEGRFYFAAPGSFRWEYIRPLKSMVISHKNNTKRYIYSDGAMVEDKTGGVQAMKIVLGEITGWMSGRFDQNPSFKATISKKKPDTMIALVPAEKNTSSMIEKIEITLSSKGGNVKSVKIFEGPDNFTQINFNNVKINESFDASVFQDPQ
ncbi:MAG: outer membrane lipoprotein carrier protein LolA [Syntrophaceae bacterium]|nr:outer membrane lipoprotein carrier protein LolA [Syntrophaceae bacterium]